MASSSFTFVGWCPTYTHQRRKFNMSQLPFSSIAVNLMQSYKFDSFSTKCVPDFVEPLHNFLSKTKSFEANSGLQDICIASFEYKHLHMISSKNKFQEFFMLIFEMKWYWNCQWCYNMYKICTRLYGDREFTLLWTVWGISFASSRHRRFGCPAPGQSSQSFAFCTKPQDIFLAINSHCAKEFNI